MNDLEKIYVEYFEPVYKFLISLGCDIHSAEEITQETMFIAIQKIDRFKGNCKLSVWLCQIAKNLYFKKRKEAMPFRLANLIASFPQTSDCICCSWGLSPLRASLQAGTFLTVL